MTEHYAASPTHSYYHADGNGNVTMLINNSQIPVAKYLYDPYGKPLSESGTKAFVNPFWFSSQLYDPDTGFLHFKYRIYIPELQRWGNRDPLAQETMFRLEESLGANLYQFVYNTPINTVDIDGRGLIGIAKCFYQVKKWGDDCLNNAPKCDNCETDKNPESLEDCITRHNKVVFDCTQKSKKMFRDCIKGTLTPPVWPKK